MTEPLYEYVRGRGWVYGVPRFLDQPYEIVDLRTNANKGVWTYQIWLVGIQHYDYRDWVDNYTNSIFSSLEVCKSHIESVTNYAHFLDLFKQGMKQRFILKDYMQGMRCWWPVRNDNNVWTEL